MTIRLMHISRRVPKAANTLSEHEILIDITQKHWLHERARVTLYAHCLSCYYRDGVFTARYEVGIRVFKYTYKSLGFILKGVLTIVKLWPWKYH
jgi:hypothetical protein